MEPNAWFIERLAAHHDRSKFDCGQPTLDEWLRKLAGQFQKRDLARTYVAIQPDSRAVCGYYALANHRVDCEALPADQAKGLPRIDIPVVLIGRLAVDRSMQGERLGEHLLLDALRRAQHLADHVGVRAVEVEARDAAAQAFYLKYGFTPLTDAPQHLFLPMQVIRKLNLPPLE